MAFLVDIIGLIIGAHVFRPFGAGRQMMAADLPIILPFKPLGAGKIMVGPIGPLVVVEIAQETGLSLIFLKIIGNTVIVNKPLDGLIGTEVPTDRRSFCRAFGRDDE